MSRDSQTGVRTTLPALSSILNAATAPLNTSPCSIGAVN
jgi:hypothetical protein